MIMAAALSFYATPMRAQSVHIRIGALAATPLIKDEVSSFAVDSAIGGRRSQGITVQQKISPIATLALVVPMRVRTLIEINGSVSRAKLTGDDHLQTWDAGTLTIVNAMIGFGYVYKNLVTLHGGVGFTRLFTDDVGLFAKGNGIRPMAEAGASTAFKAGIPLELDVRAQSHGFDTATLRDNGGSGGQVNRLVVQIGTKVWSGKR